jgi:hypothetical protein
MADSVLSNYTGRTAALPNEDAMKRKSDPTRLEVVPTEDFVRDVGILLGMTTTNLAALAKTINTKHGFGVPSKVNLAELVRSLQLPGEQFKKVHDVAKYLYGRMTATDSSVDDVLALISEVAATNKLPSPNRKKSALVQLFTPNREYLRKQKLEPFEKGVLHTISKIAFTHELRAVFRDQDRKTTQVNGFLPIATVRLVAENEKEQEETLVFSADEEALDSLIKNLSYAKDKLVAMKTAVADKPPHLY